MKTKFIAFFAIVGCLLAVSSPLSAHHGSAAYENSKEVVLKNATVTKVNWGNPHTLVLFDVKDDKGNVVHWVAEASNPASMMSHGWSARDVKVGDEVTLTMTVAKNGAPVGRVQQLILADGRKLGNDSGNAATER